MAVSEIIYYFATDLHIQSQKFIANNEFYDKNNLLPKSLRLKNFIRVWRLLGWIALFDILLQIIVIEYEKNQILSGVPLHTGKRCGTVGYPTA